MEKTKKRKLEIVLTVVLIVLAIALFGYRMHLKSVSAKETALMSELKAIRTSVQLYLTVNKQMPPDLKTLTTTNFKLGDKEALYLTGIHVDADKNPVDSFGQQFVYDPKTGSVVSGTKGYEAW